MSTELKPATFSVTFPTSSYTSITAQITSRGVICDCENYRYRTDLFKCEHILALEKIVTPPCQVCQKYKDKKEKRAKQKKTNLMILENIEKNIKIENLSCGR